MKYLVRVYANAYAVAQVEAKDAAEATEKVWLDNDLNWDYDNVRLVVDEPAYLKEKEGSA